MPGTGRGKALHPNSEQGPVSVGEWPLRATCCMSMAIFQVTAFGGYLLHVDYL
jgi:hypothetical protein